MGQKIDRPIFLIGCPRSGTTVIFESLSIHPEVGWFSHYFDKWPNLPWINIATRFTNTPFFKIELKKGRRLFPFIPEPTEAWNIWSTACGDKFLYSSLTDIDPTQSEIEFNNTLKSYLVNSFKIDFDVYNYTGIVVFDETKTQLSEDETFKYSNLGVYFFKISVGSKLVIRLISFNLFI